MKAIGIKQVAEKVNLGQSTIYRMISKGLFPKPFALGESRTAWIESDIDDWLADKAGKSRPAVSDGVVDNDRVVPHGVV